MNTVTVRTSANPTNNSQKVKAEPVSIVSVLAVALGRVSFEIVETLTDELTTVTESAGAVRT